MGNKAYARSGRLGRHPRYPQIADWRWYLLLTAHTYTYLMGVVSNAPGKKSYHISQGSGGTKTRISSCKIRKLELSIFVPSNEDEPMLSGFVN
jgi:hypothetical protein